MAAPSTAYLFGGTATFPMHIEGEIKLDCYPALFLAEHGNYIKQRFFLDALLVIDNEQGDKAFLGLIEYASANWFMHSKPRLSKGMLAKDESTKYAILNDAGLNTFGLPQFVSREGSAVNYIEFTVALLQPWYGTVTSFEIEFWAGGSRVTSITMDLANFIPNYDFGDSLEAYSPALDITRARAYKVQLSPALDVAALDNMSYDLKFIMGDELFYKEQLKTVNFPLSAPVSVLSLKLRPQGGCETSTEISKALFTEIERVRLLPGLPDPPRIIYREPNGQYVWCSQDINDYSTVFYSDTNLSVRANGWFFGGWDNYVVEVQNGLQGQRFLCQPVVIVPPRDISRFSIQVDRVDVSGNGRIASVSFTVRRNLDNGGDSGDVGVNFKIDDGHAITLGSWFLSAGSTQASGTIDHTIGKPNEFTGVTASIQSLNWDVA
ncbi:hypothetical protein [Pedobacter gandavensis]|uniref:Uncharacterized protein n=1 Tax=Pedobacter gandavensis TaxID=2679963 RepID=A0ABR6EV84_9SPHI|nr:hypothetical protein [Pedobacter gandavensis]MBB2149181.1 hypothetical protein [Pedobacter gandavensis]